MPGTPDNAEIAHKLLSLAQLLAAQGENKFKVKAYRRAARTIGALGESLADSVQHEMDLTRYPGIGDAIGAAIQEIVRTGSLRQLEALRSQAGPQVEAISDYPRLDTKRVLRVYKKLGISSVPELRDKLENGEIAASLGQRMAQHVRQALIETHEILLYEADAVAVEVERYLIEKCKVARAVVAGDVRRRVEVISEISFLVDTDRFPEVVSQLERFGGKAQLVSSMPNEALLKLSSGVLLRVRAAKTKQWGVAMIASTGSEHHLRKLEKLASSKKSSSTETGVYAALGLSFIEPEMREGEDEIELAAAASLPDLISTSEIRGELHAHTTSSDGTSTVEQMATAARRRGYEYIGITDHSQSLKIAGGMTEKLLWEQIRYIDNLNARLHGFRVLKSAEVDILADGSLDYPDELLKELDYTVCSIHSRFGLGKEEQTRRILRAMDNRYFSILGHATGRLLLKRAGYEIDVERVIEHARRNGCFFEINSSPDRLDLSAAHARLARQAGVRIAVTTDAHSPRDFDLLQYGIDQARRAGLGKEMILNSRPWPDLLRLLKRQENPC